MLPLQTKRPILSFEDWKQQLINLTSEQTGRPAQEIKLDEFEAKEWWKAGFSPYVTFRENYKTI